MIKQLKKRLEYLIDKEAKVLESTSGLCGHPVRESTLIAVLDEVKQLEEKVKCYNCRYDLSIEKYGKSIGDFCEVLQIATTYKNNFYCKCWRKRND